MLKYNWLLKEGDLFYVFNLLDCNFVLILEDKGLWLVTIVYSRLTVNIRTLDL